MGKRKQNEGAADVATQGVSSEGTKKNKIQQKIIVWNDEILRNLIAWHSSHPLLWQKTDDDYKDKGKKRSALKAWLIVEKILPEPPKNEAPEEDKEKYNERALKCIEEVEDKFHAQRVRLNRELGKIPKWKSGQGVDDILETDSTWKFFKDIMFLRYDISTRKTQSNLNVDVVEVAQGNSANEDQDENLLEEFRAFMDDSVVFNEKEVVQLQKELVGPSGSKSPSINDKSKNTKPQPKDKKSVYEEKKFQMMEQCVGVLTKAAAQNKDEDHVDCFFKYCRAALKNLPFQRQNHIINEMQKVLFRQLE